jgi:branched-chain amino acid transport system ATP-binding protein
MSESSRHTWAPRPTEADVQAQGSGPGVVLEVEELEAWYGPLQVLRRVTLHVSQGEVVALLGPNGAGKTTLLRSLAGLLRPRAGVVRLRRGQQSHDIVGLPPHRVLAHGVAYVAQGQDLFPLMSVEENIEMGGYLLRSSAERRLRRDRLLERFPLLKQRAKQRAAVLSGGERQLLKLSRGLMIDPLFLLLDEPSAGLAPSLARQLFRDIRLMADTKGVGVLLAEQNVAGALSICDRVYVLSVGRVVASGTPLEIEREEVLRRYFLGFASRDADVPRRTPDTHEIKG